MGFCRVDVTLLTIRFLAFAFVGLLAADPTLDRFHTVRFPARVASLTVLLVVGVICSWKGVNARAFPTSPTLLTSEIPVHSFIEFLATSGHCGVAELYDRYGNYLAVQIQDNELNNTESPIQTRLYSCSSGLDSTKRYY